MPNLEALPTEGDIRRMVETFYERIRLDPLLAPIFERRVSNWDTHLDTMTAFWANVLLARPGFKGDPVGKHHAMTELRPAHFDRWIALFGEVTSELFDPLMAVNILTRARRMRVVLERLPDSVSAS